MNARPTIQFTYLHYLVAIVSAVVVSLVLTGSINTANATGVEDGSVEQHKKFEISAFLAHDEIIDGTGLNSHMDGPGYDNAPDNGVVRTWDTISYPLRITVNPKGTDVLENIELEITGSLDGGITDGRANARFAVGGTEDMENETVTFKQNYTIERTGSAIMFPVSVEVLGATHGTKLTPDMKVQVVSVDGEDIRDDDIVIDFTDLPTTEVTAAVALKPEVRNGLGALGIPSYPLSNLTGNEDDEQNVHMFTVAWGIGNLPGTNSKKGATFPDPDGVIDFDIVMNGSVHWEGGPLRDKTTTFDFGNGGDTAFKLFDMKDNSAVKQSVGAKNTESEGLSYEFEHANINNAAYSKMPDFDPKTIDKYKKGNVWDSGDWKISKPTISDRNVTYSGTNTNYVIGSTFPDYSGYTQNRQKGAIVVGENHFATQTFLVQLENEYYVGGGRMNPDNHGNVVTYNATLRLNGYTAPDGSEIKFDKNVKRTFKEVNSSDGTYSFYNDFAAYPSGEQLGTYISNMGSLSKGDAYTLIGEDVQFRARLQSNVAFRGGVKLMYHWNTDAFRLTDDYAARAERSIMNAGYESMAQEHVRNNEDTQNVFYGVPKKSINNEFKTLRLAHHTDYTWYDTYAEAAEAGSVGAILNDVTDSVGAVRYPQVNIPLRVLHNNIGTGSTSSDNPEHANIAVLSPYGYMDEDRELDEVDISAGATMGNPAIWDEMGVMKEMQNPIRGYSNFETLAVIPAEVSTKLTPESSTYYSSERADWKSESKVNLPGGSMPEEYDPGVTLHHILPDGLDYVPGSGRVDGEPVEPELWQTDDGDMQLRWTLLISSDDTSIPDVEFETTTNSDAFKGVTGTSTNETIRSVIESQLDNRPESFRTGEGTILVRAIGRAGVSEDVVPASGNGPKNSTYELHVKPFTEIEAEPNIAGVKVLPINGENGSNFSGNLELTNLVTVIGSGSEVARKDVKTYVNDNAVDTTYPQNIDFTKDGWREYKRGDDLSNVQSFGFKIDGLLTRNDNITFRLILDTEGNEFGDVYDNRTSVNSGRNYEESPIANVNYSISPDLELRLDRFQIFTNKESVGLPSFTRVHQIIGSHLRDPASDPEGQDAVEDLSMTLAIYDTDTGEKVAEKAYNQPDIKNENDILINTDAVGKGDVSNYEVRIENYDTDRVWVREGNGTIDTDGHTSKEGTLTEEDINDDGVIAFKGVTMTERERGKDMVTFNENLTVDPFDPVKTKSGYGFEMNAGVKYQNSLMERIESLVDDVAFETDTRAVMDRNLIDESLSFYDDSEDNNIIPMIESLPDNPEVDEVPEAEANTIAKRYELPEIFMAKNSGLTYTDAQVDASDSLNRLDMLEGGNQLFVPVWIDTLGIYDAALQSDSAMGSHFMNFNVTTPVDVYAYMLHHIDSETGDEDELLLKPVERDELPDFWNTDDEE